MFSYSLSLPFESFHLRNITLASTLAGLYVLGSLSKLTTERRIVLKMKTKLICLYVCFNWVPVHCRCRWALYTIGQVTLLS